MRSLQNRLHIDVHDRSQIELRNLLHLDGAHRPSSLEVDTYLFVPQSVGLNGQNYKRDQFYADTTALMRIDSAPQSLESLVDVESTSSPLRPIADALERFRTGDRVPSSIRLAVHVKLFAYTMTQAVVQEIDRVVEHLDAGDRAAFSEALEGFLARAGRALAGFRSLRAAFWPFEPLCHHTFNSALAIADEYMSLFLEERLALLVERIEGESGNFDGTAFVPRTKETIRAFAAAEAAHRLKFGFLIHAADKKSLREYYTYRRSLLKKSIHQALYLDARKVTKDAFIKNSVGAVGAALAAIWAWATQLPATVADLPTNTKLAFFFGAVGAYVAKDRIKAATNEYLVDKFKRFDKSSMIRGASLEEVGLGMLSGRLEERMRFVPFEEVDELIRHIRLQGRSGRFLSQAASQEEVIHYRKILSVDSAGGEALPEGYGMLDIFRLNIRHFLSRLDDPTESVCYFDVDKKNFARSKLPKVYHVNVVVRLKANDGPEHFEHFRMILDKKGIVRTDQVDVSPSMSRDLGPRAL